MHPSQRILSRLLCATALAGAAACQAQWRAETGVLLIGKVATRNDAGEVLPDARIWLANGRTIALARSGGALPEGAADAPVIDTGGEIYLGIIDLHNHPECAVYPLLPVQRAYRDRYEWRWYDDIDNKRITYLQEVLTGPHYLDLGIELRAPDRLLGGAGGGAELP